MRGNLHVLFYRRAKLVARIKQYYHIEINEGQVIKVNTGMMCMYKVIRFRVGIVVRKFIEEVDGP